jgi:hypothetical protein
MVDFLMGKSGAGAGFLRELWFPLPIYIPSASPQSSSLSPKAGTIGQEGLKAQHRARILNTRAINTFIPLHYSYFHIVMPFNHNCNNEFYYNIKL